MTQDFESMDKILKSREYALMKTDIHLDSSEDRLVRCYTSATLCRQGTPLQLQHVALYRARVCAACVLVCAVAAY
jgi:hypothetical protein